MQTRNTIVGKSKTTDTKGGSTMKKKILSMLLAIVTVISMLSVGGISASAVTMVGTNEYVTIRNSGSKSYLSVSGSRSNNNTNITVGKWNNTGGVDFKFVPCSKGYLLIPRCATSRAVNIYGNSAKNGSNVCSWSVTRDRTQIFIPEYVKGMGGYLLKSADNQSLVLTATGNTNGANVIIKQYYGSKHQIWTSPALSEMTSVKKPNTSFNKENFLQWDSRWSNATYGKSVRYDLRNAGCGILSNVNAVYNLTGKFIQPTELAKWAADKGYYNGTYGGGCGAVDQFFKDVAAKYGASCGFKYAGRGNSITDQKLINHLKNGGTAVVNVYNHYISIVGYDANKGYQVFDCAPEYNSNGSRNGTGRPTHAGGDWLKANQFTGMMQVTNGYWMYAKK